MNNELERFTRRLSKLDIEVTYKGNYPWIYFDTINDIKVKGKFHANHGWTAFILHNNGSYRFSDRKEVFKKIREYIRIDDRVV